MSKLHILIVALILALVPGSASATQYSANLYLQSVQNNNGALYWNTISSFNLTIGDTKTISPFSFNYLDIEQGSNPQMITMTVTGGTQTLIGLRPGGTECIKGNCNMNGTVPLNLGDMRIGLSSLTPISGTNTTSSSGVVSSDNVVDVYIQCPSSEKLHLDKDGENSYNPSICNTKNGWANSNNKEVIVYIHRNYKVPVAPFITTNGAFKEEIVDDETSRFILSSNDVYEFRITSTRQSRWGGDIEEVSKYTLTVSELAGTSSGSGSITILPTSYDVKIGSSKEFQLPSGGSFSQNSYLTITPGTTQNGKTNWIIGFTSPGSTSVEYKETNGKITPISFNILPAEVATPEPTPQKNTLSGFQIPEGRTLMLGAFVIIFVAVGYMYFTRTKKHGRERGLLNDKII